MTELREYKVNTHYMERVRYENLPADVRERFDSQWEIVGYSEYNKNGIPRIIEFRAKL